MSKKLPNQKNKLEQELNSKEEARLRDLAKDVMFPILMEHSTSIKDAKNICNSLAVGMNALFTKKLKEYETYLNEDKLSILQITEQMSDEGKTSPEAKLAEALKDETISTAQTMVVGMEAELARLVEEELKDRPLETLKMDWLQDEEMAIE